MAPNRNPAIKFTQIFINNEFVNSVSGKVFPVINPSTGKKIIDVQEGDKADVDKAVVAAKAAFAAKSKWRSLDASKRAQYLLTLADLLKRDQDYIASLETLENGKPYKCAQEDVDDATEALKYYAAYADKVYGKTIPVVQQASFINNTPRHLNQLPQLRTAVGSMLSSGAIEKTNRAAYLNPI
ncbi:hypothetical protein HPB47_017660 [Ixodes persulcatus]|uniref:Uncharacterized protein n=1 Tax=Ixodes persulcatus TaxID=34615 RepID=A0AC60QNQ6_IXOPE|nr:hypothetical protein HPB47_017660 [Ixodes persulcatus]